MILLIRIETQLPDTPTTTGFVGKCWELIKVCADKEEAERHMELVQKKFDKFVMVEAV